MMNSFVRSVVGMDGSAQARRALDWAVEEAISRWRGGRAAIVDVVAAWQDDTLTPIGVYVSTAADPHADARRIVADALATVANHPGVKVTGAAVEGPASDVLSRAADGADLLVLGGHGHRRMRHAVLGRVAEECVRNAVCSVVVIPVRHSSSASRSPKARLRIANG